MLSEFHLEADSIQYRFKRKCLPDKHAAEMSGANDGNEETFD